MAIDLNKIREQYEKLNKKGDGNNEEFFKQFLKLEDGENPVRILPPWNDEGVFYVATALHRIPDGMIWHCRRVKNEQCPICELYFELWKQHNLVAGKDKSVTSPFRKKATEIKPNKRYFMNALDRRTGEVKVLSVGSIIFDKIISSMMDPDDPLGDVTDPITGFDLKIVKITPKGGSDQWPKYDQTKFRTKSSPLGTKEEIAKYLDQLYDLNKFVPLEKYEQMKIAIDSFAVSIGKDLTSSPTPEAVQTDSLDQFKKRLETKED